MKNRMYFIRYCTEKDFGPTYKGDVKCAGFLENVPGGVFFGQEFSDITGKPFQRAFVTESEIREGLVSVWAPNDKLEFLTDYCAHDVSLPAFHSFEDYEAAASKAAKLLARGEDWFPLCDGGK